MATFNPEGDDSVSELQRVVCEFLDKFQKIMEAYAGWARGTRSPSNRVLLHAHAVGFYNGLMIGMLTLSTVGF